MTDPTLDEEVFAFPTSFAEQRLWFLDQVDPYTAVYNVAQGIRLEGPLELPILERCLHEIVARHESLRTTFVGSEGVPLQVVAPTSQLKLRVVDLRGRPQPEREEEAKRLANAEAETPFDLEKGPLLRALAIIIENESHVLVLNAHHIVCDGSSLALLFAELSALYPAFAAERPSPLPPVVTQYADFALWQNDWLKGEELERSLAFWKPLLAEPLTVLELPSDRPRPLVQSFRGDSFRFFLSKELTTKLGALARLRGASLFMLTLAAWSVLLHRISNQNEILIGTPIANRERAEIENSIGFYTNTVVFRTNLESDQGKPLTFGELLDRVRKRTMDVLAHQDIPFEKVVEAVQPARTTSHNPIFQAMFGLQKAPESALQLPGIRATPIDVHSGTSKFDLTVDMQEIGDEMQGLMEYSTDLFDRPTAERFAKQFVTLLEGIVENPTACISDLPLLTADEQRTILADWNATAAPYPTACVHDLLATQVAGSPKKAAVEFEGNTLTYEALDQRSSQLARHLLTLGVQPGTLIALYMNRSLDMMVGIFGVLKAGGAYLPLDPAYPHDRVAYMLEDARASVVLTQSELRDDLPEVSLPSGEPPSIVSIDDEWEHIAKASGDLPEHVSPEQRAYVIYTSGSTGKPKGVEVPHRSVVNFLTSMARVPGLGPEDRLLAITTLSFDIAGLELFLPLTVGATVVLASRESATDGKTLLDTLLGSDITVLQATPATYRMLLDAGWEPGVRPLRLLCGGEALPPSLVTPLLERASELWNMYGPTETTIWSTAARITDESAISIGRPIANTQVYVLDASLQPVPIGVVGDLYIGGDGVALGYLERPELTRERFLENPFVPGHLIYKTGDKARFDANRDLHFLGRGDTQVKLRGFRIELGEIEAALAEHEDVRQAVVAVRTDATGDARLVAYMVYRTSASPTPSELRKHLRKTLPDHMIPHFFLEQTAIPLTQNGKVDRRALPDPFSLDRRAVQESTSTAPNTETEKIVAEIWRDLLKVPNVGIHDNFFDLGGHSLLSMQVIHRIAARTGHRLNPRSMVYGNLQQVSAECEQT